MEGADLLVVAIMQSLISSVPVMHGAVNSLLIQRYKRKRAKLLNLLLTFDSNNMKKEGKKKRRNPRFWVRPGSNVLTSFFELNAL